MTRESHIFALFPATLEAARTRCCFRSGSACLLQEHRGPMSTFRHASVRALANNRQHTVEMAGCCEHPQLLYGDAEVRATSGSAKRPSPSALWADQSRRGSRLRTAPQQRGWRLTGVLVLYAQHN